MKDPKEYLKQLFEEPFQLEDETSIEYDFYKVIKEIQKDAWNDAIKNVVKNSKLDRQSILKLKIK